MLKFGSHALLDCERSSHKHLVAYRLHSIHSVIGSPFHWWYTTYRSCSGPEHAGLEGSAAHGSAEKLSAMEARCGRLVGWPGRNACHAGLAEASSNRMRALGCGQRAVSLQPEALLCEQVPLSRMRSWRARQRWWPPTPSSPQRRASPGPCECLYDSLAHCQARLFVGCCQVYTHNGCVACCKMLRAQWMSW